jgi:hypothetical protein
MNPVLRAVVEVKARQIDALIETLAQQVKNNPQAAQTLEKLKSSIGEIKRQLIA